MKKLLVLLVSILLLTLPVGAYSVEGYELDHEAGMLLHIDSGEVLYAKNAEKRMYPASLTKLMTAIVMVEAIDDLDTTMITYSATAAEQLRGSGAVALQLKIGEKLTAKDALASLLIASHGDVAYAIAEHVGGSIEGFVDKMNEKAAALQLADTHFTNPVGLHDDDHYSTVNDIRVIVTAAFQHDIIKQLASTPRYVLAATNMAGKRTIVSTNMLVNPSSSLYYEYAVAGKTGYTSKAGRCLIATASHNGYEYLSIILKADTADGVQRQFIDTANLFRWAFDTFEFKTVGDPSAPITEAPIKFSSETDALPITFENEQTALLPKTADTSAIGYTIHLSEPEFSAPVEKGTIVGTAEILYSDNTLATVNLVAAQTVRASAALVFAENAKTFLASPLMKTVYILLALLMLTAVGLRSRNRKKRRSKRRRT